MTTTQSGVPALPEAAAEITAEWLAEVLDAGGVPGAGHLAGVAAEPLRAGSGVFGELSRLRLSYDRVGTAGPASVIVKLPSRQPVNRARGRGLRLYEREVCFYRDLADTIAVRVPRCYLSRFDPDGRAVLVLEDLTGWQPGDELSGLRADQARVAAEQIARVHARWWQSPRLTDLDWLPAVAGPVSEQLTRAFRATWPAWAARRHDELPAAARTLGERVCEEFAGHLDALSRPPVTLAHGDLRADNLVFRGGPGSGPVAILDWQLACRARGAYDVAYLLCQSMTVADRRRHERAILRAWHVSLLRAGVTGYSFRDAMGDYQRSILVCIGCAVAGDSLQRTTLRDRALTRTQAVRCLTAALDHFPTRPQTAIVRRPLLLHGRQS